MTNRLLPAMKIRTTREPKRMVKKQAARMKTRRMRRRNLPRRHSSIQKG
jgi:hypothetical protein